MISVPGYDYADPPSDVASEANKIVSADSQHLKSASAHVVLHEGKLIAAILLVQVQPQYADLPEVQQNMVPSMVEDMAGSGVSVTQETIHSEKVVVAKSDSEAVYAWYHNGEVTMVAGDNGPDVRDYVGAYLQVAHAQAALGGQ